MIELYEFALSGNCHKVRLMLSFLELDYKSKLVNGSAREHKSSKFLTMNPLGQLPILKDNDITIRDSQAILIYLAHRYGGDQWWPKSSEALAKIVAWLFTVSNEIARGPNALRLHHKFGRQINIEDAQAVTETILNIMEEYLSNHDWIALDVPTIADVALYPYIALAHEGKVDLSRFPSVVAWLVRFKALPRYVSMPGM
ncbi:glutathione S-transferase family protein [Methylotenera sp.]|uniref:glutathione S-transferase family protein n=1 Tax=Methylotenera sp. TaxID=2051956 RepID=UPI0027364D3A|nr:glutathione S-transferase N-terminal domain-containing protein [Methylotenera sp.]MDP3004661.1 glutathione S-transferase N-terminal domain-containing protein [Methylotenera sp.]